MGVFNERKRLIMNMRYGLDGEKICLCRNRQILGITRERARQLKAKIILKLRGIEDFK